MTDTKTMTKETQRISYHIILKLQKLKDEEKILQEVGRKNILAIEIQG